MNKIMMVLVALFFSTTMAGCMVREVVVSDGGYGSYDSTIVVPVPTYHGGSRYNGNYYRHQPIRNYHRNDGYYNRPSVGHSNHQRSYRQQPARHDGNRKCSGKHCYQRRRR